MFWRKSKHQKIMECIKAIAQSIDDLSDRLDIFEVDFKEQETDRQLLTAKIEISIERAKEIEELKTQLLQSRDFSNQLLISLVDKAFANKKEEPKPLSALELYKQQKAERESAENNRYSASNRQNKSNGGFKAIDQKAKN